LQRYNLFRKGQKKYFFFENLIIYTGKHQGVLGRVVYCRGFQSHRRICGGDSIILPETFGG